MELIRGFDTPPAVEQYLSVRTPDDDGRILSRQRIAACLGQLMDEAYVVRAPAGDGRFVAT